MTVVTDSGRMAEYSEVRVFENHVFVGKRSCEFWGARSQQLTERIEERLLGRWRRMLSDEMEALVRLPR